jgi:hypothetical protein
MARLLSVTAGALMLVANPSSALAQTAPGLAGSELKGLISGRSLAISHYGDPANAASTSVWDFRKDGSICARYVGAKRSEKCAEEGKWSVADGALCWELPTIGRGLGTNPACSTVGQVKPDRLELRNVKSPDLPFAQVLLLKP